MSNTTQRRGRSAKPAVEETASTTTMEATAPTPSTSSTKSTFKVRQDIKPNQILEFELLKKSGAIFLMQQKNVTIVDDGKLREIRYCPNEPSIYRDEQADNSVRKAIMFTDGRLFVRPDQPNLKNYLLAHPDNVSNGGQRFKLVDKSKDKEISLEQEFELHDAVSLIRTKELNELLSVAVAMGINIDRPVSEIKHDLMVTAKRNPKNFIQAFDNPAVDMKTKILQAQKYQIINTRDNGVYWFDSGKMIVSVPAGKDPVDVFVRYCLTEAGSVVANEIDRQLQ
jgi:hypothetical protein